VNCLTHSDAAAVATCCGCGRGMCAQCTTQSENKQYVCSPACASRVSLAESVLLQISSKQAKASNLTGWVYIFFGLVFLVPAVGGILTKELELAVFMTLFSLGFLIGGVFFFRNSRRST